VISAAGGHVVTDRTNLFIRLAPYFVPFYTTIAALVFGAAGLIRPLPDAALWSLYSVLGFTWAFHLTFTLRMMRIQQPDFESGGRFFSLMVIGLANLCLLCLLLVMASPNVSLQLFAESWIDQTLAMSGTLLRMLGGS
jgi:hypothetical protein